MKKVSTMPQWFASSEPSTRALVVETEDNAVLERSNLSVASYDDMILDDVELSYGTKVSLHIGSSSELGMSTEAKLKASEQQNANLRVTTFGQHTESEKYHHGSQQTENADELDLNGEDVEIV